VWRELGISRGHLLGHDYGTSIVTELIARRERGLLALDLLSLTLTNGSVHIELADLALSQKLLANKLFAKVGTVQLFKAQLRRIFGDPGAVPEEELDLLWEALVHRGGRERLPQIACYIEERWRFWNRWIAPLTRLDLSAHILWGRRDPIAVWQIAARLASEIPKARLTWLDDLGHYPMLESPARYAEALLSFLPA
jgi:pimeloyl-ACP methyl ester carboxylesterase